MTNSTKRDIKSSAALVGTGAIVLPLVTILLEGLAEIMNQPIWADKVGEWFGAGSIISLLILTVGYRIVAHILNNIAENKAVEQGVARASRESEPIKI